MSSEIESSSDKSSHQVDHVSDVDKGSQKHEKLETRFVAYDRVRHPTTYSITFDSYAKMVKMVKDGYYESLPFTSGGYTWTFKIYPNGNTKVVGLPGFWVSVYTKIDTSIFVTNPQDVYAEIKFFVYDGFKRVYSTHQESEPVRFDKVKSEWGIPFFLGTGCFIEGLYLYDGGKCEVGIDILVDQRYQRELFSYDENVINPVFTWNITNFSTLYHHSYTSNTFSSGDRNWVLKVYPNGYGVGKDRYLSLYLLSVNNEVNYVEGTLRVLNQITSGNVVKQVEGWPNAAENGWGFQEFISLADLQVQGFVVNDLLQVQVEITAFSKRTPFT
ncbi:PREDICTED: uncharacterized protein LOC104780431 [Camelina sativa]|uniref:Uncharacterized protein LOC104780431 n=1 Tax=Camelina sativa TaxID=90675 RepID=A0ABM0YMH3_CAMSA|nr:PREDICTED: uncharacterized protein LOC104780431 [Camelina sativa]